MHSVLKDNSSFTTPSSLFKTDSKPDYNPITPLRFSESEEDEYRGNEESLKTPIRSDMINDDDVDFTPIKTPWRKSSATENVIEDENNDYVDMNYSPSEDEELRSSSVDTNDLLTFTPMGYDAGRAGYGDNKMSRKLTKSQQQTAIQLDYANNINRSMTDNKNSTTTSASTSKDVKSKLDLFLENNKDILRSMGKAEQVFKRATEKVLAQCSSSSLIEKVEDEDHTTPVNANERDSVNRKQPNNLHSHDMTTPTITTNNMQKDQRNPHFDLDCIVDGGGGAERRKEIKSKRLNNKNNTISNDSKIHANLLPI